MSLSSAPKTDQFNLRTILYHRASRYTPSETVRLRIVHRAILCITANLVEHEKDDLAGLLLHILHKVALEEIGTDTLNRKIPRSLPARPVLASCPKVEALAAPLRGKRFLIVEDDYLTAFDMMSIVEKAGGKVFGPVSDVARTLEIIGAESFSMDAAILDVNLNGEMVYPAAEQLLGRGMPFLFVTGYSCSALPEEFEHAPCLPKPFDGAALIEVLASIPSRAPVT